MRGLAEAALLAGLIGGAVVEGRAQIRASERGTVSQTIDGAVITVDYSRPRVRGRDPIFGKVVHPGEIWTPGANWATTLDLSRDVRLDGHPVPKGKYSVWFLVGPGDWTLILDRRAQRYHTEVPDSIEGQLRWVVRPTTIEPTEVLTWSFPSLRLGGGVLRMQWSTKQVALDLVVAPRHPLTIARGEAAPYLGRYRLSMTLGETDTSWVKPDILDLVYENGSLMARFQAPPAWWPSLARSVMVRINDDWFIPAIVTNGEIYEMAADLVFEFTVTNGVAASIEVRDDHDEVLGRGVRVVGSQ